MENLNIDLYSRQIRAYGIDTMQDLAKLTVLIVGIRGLGVETTKNLILAGPKEVHIFDPEKCSINDLGSNYYININDVKEGKRRDEASLKELIHLNPYVNLSIMNGDDIFSNLIKYNVIVITEMMDENILIKLNEECRRNHIGFIYSCSLGISGFIFSDFGENFIIKDFNGLELKSYVIDNITNEKQGLITIDDTVGWHSKFTLNDEDMVIFSDIKGMEELNDGKPRNIIKKDDKSFYIQEDTTQYGKYFKGGNVKQYKKPIVKNYKSLKERIEIPYEDDIFIEPIDYTKGNINPILHCGFMSIQQYFTEKKKLPELNDLEESKIVVELAKKKFNKYKEEKVEWINDDEIIFDEKIVEKIARWSKAEISPVCSILGGILAQEVVKFTGKYTPIEQWMWFDFFETVSLLNENIERNLEGTRYDDLISIYGNEIQKKLEKINLFLIGAGANGCEFLKNFALMGISCSEGKITVTDNDIIELSNLNRQFLFRNENIGDYKSKIACENVKKINPKLNIKDLQFIVCEETENIFNDSFWVGQDLIIFGVDNNDARRYIDAQCTNLTLTGIDAGTLGTKGRVQLIVPHKTICFRDNPKEDDEDESVPMCTLHHFPTTILHCIEWGKVRFLEIVNEGIKDLKNYIEDPEKYFIEKEKENSIIVKESINLTLQYIKLLNGNDLNHLLEFCIHLHKKFFDDNIEQILEMYPPNSLNKDGTLYWSGSKRIPHPIRYDSNNELSLMFVTNLTLLLSKVFNIKIDEKKIKEQSENIKVELYSLEKYDIESNENKYNNELNENKQNNNKLIEKQEIRKILEKIELNNYLKEKIKLIIPIEFDKENNIHISVIHSFANLRASNFNIECCSILNTKLISGKIIPSIPTSTACVGGFVSLQILNLIQTHDLSILRNSYFNLAVSLVNQLEPDKVKRYIDNEFNPLLNNTIKAIPNGWSIWDQIEIKESKTVNDFIKFIKDTYNFDLTLITSENIVIFNSRSKNLNIILDQKIEEIYLLKKGNIKKDYIWLNVSGKINKMIVFIPKFKYFYSKNH